MKNLINIFMILLCPFVVMSQNLEVDGDAKINGRVTDVADPVNAQDAATMAYVDALEAKVDLLINLLVNEITLNVQQRLGLGETPKHIFDSGIAIDSFYGKTYQGGLIFYLDTTTGVGYVAAPTDQDTAALWGCYETFINGADGKVIGTGNQNTIDIVADCTTAGIAADICINLDLNGYSDWFLPSKDELSEMYLKLKVNGFGDFASEYYWSSSEGDDLAAWRSWFVNGSPNFGSKLGGWRVRAIRAF